MAQKIVLGFLFEKMMKDLTRSINSEHKNKIEHDINDKLVRLLGSDWSKLPVTGPRMMALVLVLNIVLVPMGIVPAVLFDIALKKGKEYEIDTKFLQLMEGVKQSTGLSNEKLTEFSKYAEQTASNLKYVLKNVGGETISGVKTIFSRSKDMVGNIRKTKEKKDYSNDNNRH